MLASRVADLRFKFVTLPAMKSCYAESQMHENKSKGVKCSVNDPEPH